MIGADDDPADGFAIPWAAEEPHFAVKLYAIAYHMDASITSDPIWILLDWRQATATSSG